MPSLTSTAFAVALACAIVFALAGAVALALDIGRPPQDVEDIARSRGIDDHGFPR